MHIKQGGISNELWVYNNHNLSTVHRLRLHFLIYYTINYFLIITMHSSCFVLYSSPITSSTVDNTAQVQQPYEAVSTKQGHKWIHSHLYTTIHLTIKLNIKKFKSKPEHIYTTSSAWISTSKCTKTKPLRSWILNLSNAHPIPFHHWISHLWRVSLSESYMNGEVTRIHFIRRCKYEDILITYLMHNRQRLIHRRTRPVQSSTNTYLDIFEPSKENVDQTMVTNS